MQGCITSPDCHTIQFVGVAFPLLSAQNWLENVKQEVQKFDTFLQWAPDRILVPWTSTVLSGALLLVLN